jgi:RHS repeat-associated protein
VHVVRTGARMHYNYFRDYDPAVGRYVQSDPLGIEVGISTYAYVDSSPLKHDDPLGLQKGGPPIPGNFGRPPHVPAYWRKDYYRDYRDGYFTRPCFEYRCPVKDSQVCTPSNPRGDPPPLTSGPSIAGPSWSPDKEGCVCADYGWNWQRGLAKVPGVAHRAGY